MSVPAISAVSSAIPATPGLGSIDLRSIGITDPQSSGFGSVLAGAVEGLTAAQSRSSALAVQAVTGELADVHAYTIAATEAQVALELTVAVRNKAVDAFNEIMRMQA
jgi:flagellar hook-basal body complex protein FliE